MPRRRRPGRVGRARLRLLVVGLLPVAALGLVATPAPTASATGSIRLFQFNMCGRVCPWPTPVKIAAVIDAIGEFRPAAAGLNEVCRSEFSGIASGIASRGWRMSAAFLVTRNDVCNDGTDYGNVVLTRAKIGAVDHTFYRAQGRDNGEVRGLLCVTADLGRRPLASAPPTSSTPVPIRPGPSGDARSRRPHRWSARPGCRSC